MSRYFMIYDATCAVSRHEEVGDDVIERPGMVEAVTRSYPSVTKSKSYDEAKAAFSNIIEKGGREAVAAETLEHFGL